MWGGGATTASKTFVVKGVVDGEPKYASQVEAEILKSRKKQCRR
jgi:hypothetical protein